MTATDVELTEIVYTSEASAKGGRTGHVHSSDGVIDLDLGKPGSQANPKANPETLFAAGYAACFQGALAARAKGQDIDTSDSTVTADVSLGKTADGGVGLAVTLKVEIPGVDRAKAEELVALAHETCPYSKATRGNIPVTLTVV
ncbi:MAG: lipoyl-dependent peroxiredoxin [Pseudonocardiales bacterium]|jgi:Ohr subfamily peroxiredoxin|nr:lipoyl-dependent peroxiredoxin [Pseudonocardiales bacterium]